MKSHSILLLILSSTGILAVFNNNSVQGASLTSNSNVIVNNRILGGLAATVNKATAANDTIDIVFKTNANTTIDQLQSSLGIDHFNWLQIITLDTNPPVSANRQPLVAPYIDFPNGGYGYAFADNIPWYWNETTPLGIDCKIKTCNSGLYDETGSNFLKFADNPTDTIVGTRVTFATYLIADFGNRTYDTLGGFSWSMQVDANKRTNIFLLDNETTLLDRYVEEVGHEFPGYTKVLRLPTYSFSNSLVPGNVDSFIKKGISPAESFVAWTDNLPRVNPPRKPDTILGTFNESGGLIASNDDGGILQPNWGSGVTGYANLDGTIRMKVTGYPDFDFDGRTITSTTRCSSGGGSGGGGCTTTNSYEPHNQSGKYKLYVKLDEDSFPSAIRNTISSSGMNLMNFKTQANNSPLQQRGTEESTTDYQEMSYFDLNDPEWWADNQEISYFDPNDTEWLADYREMSYFDPNDTEWWTNNKFSGSPVSTPESTSVLGLLALSAWGIIKALKIRQDKEP